MCNCIQLRVCVRAFLHFCNCSWRCYERDGRGGIILDIVVLGRPIATCKVVCCSKFAPFCGNITAAWSVCQCMRWHVHIVSLQARKRLRGMKTYVHMYLYLSTYVRCSLIFRAIFAVFYGTIDWQFCKLQVQVLNFQLLKHIHKMRLHLLQGVPSVDVSQSSSNKRWWPWACVY